MPMSKVEKKKLTILKITVANKVTVFPGDVVECEPADALVLVNGDKAKEYEKGDEEKFKPKKEAPKK